MEKEFQELITKAKNGDLEAQTKIIDKYYGLVRFISNKYPTNAVLNKEDYYSEGCLGVLDAIQVYDSSKGAFSTIAFYYIKKKVASLFRYNKKEFQRPYQYLYDPINSKSGNGDYENNKPILDLYFSEDELSSIDLYIKNEEINSLREAIRKLPPEYKNIIKKRYYSGDEIPTLAQIGENMGVSRQRIGVIDRKAVSMLKDMVNDEKVKKI